MTAEQSHEERLRTNYSETGVEIMQALYSDDYLSIGGTESSAELARLAGVDQSTRVLDVGCGVGGPMLHLAESIGCTVCGIDLVDTSIFEARRRAEHRGLSDLATFEEANALALPFADGDFDVVWGQDAWCHIPDKATMLSEGHRVLRPGGTIAFTDWIRGDAADTRSGEAALDAALSPAAATAPEYLELLIAAGFNDVEHEDISATFLSQYREICARLDADRETLVEQFGTRIYDIVHDTNSTVLTGFEEGAITGGRFLASR